MKPLLNKTNFGKFRYISESIRNEAHLDQCITEAQIFDVKKWLGDALLNELITQYTGNNITTANQLLLDGGDYLCDSLTYTFSGLRACIIYYAWSRYIKRDQVKFTATGIVRKDGEFSEPATLKDLQMLSSDATANADALKLEVIDFLNRNKENYPLWKCTSKRRTATFKIIGE
jgi:hypothetical protein